MNFQNQVIPRHDPPSHDHSISIASRARVIAEALFESAEAADRSTDIAPRTWELLHQSGLMMAPFPASCGGEDLWAPERHADLAAVLRLIGGGDLSIARLYEGHVNAISLVCRYGSIMQITTLADAVREGAVSAVWGAEDAVGLRAELIDAEWRLDGYKIFASGAGVVTHPVVTARRGAEQILLLPTLSGRERADASGWTALGMRSSATGVVDFSGLRLGADQILGTDGDFMRQPHFSGGAWRFCAVHLGATERLVDLFREHLVTRKRDGDPFQMQRVAHCATAVTTAAFWVNEAARRMASSSEEPERTVCFVNMTRMVTERAALDVLEAVQRGVGLQAFLRPHAIERVARDLATYLRQPVPDLAMADAGRAVLASTRRMGELWELAS